MPTPTGPPAGPAGRDRLDRLFDPRSIAVVGATTDPAKRGYQALRALIAAGYADPVYPVNPKGGTVLGHPVLRTVTELPGGIDVALIATPAATVPAILRDCAAAGIAGAVVLANGFRESGPAGADLEDAVRRVVADTGIRVVGPNTSGILTVASGANLVGVGDVPLGPVSVITQSGNMLLSLLADDRAHRGPGFDTYIGLGNQADIGYDECLTHLARRKTTGAIAVHSEGFRDGRSLLVAAAQASRARPVVMLRGGRSAAGQRSALSHTGSIAGSDEVATAVLRQAGVELVDRSDELAVVSAVLATAPPMRPGLGVAVLSDGGGHATLAVDALSRAGVAVATLAETTQATLRGLLGPAASVTNPVDVAGATDQDPRLFAACAQAIAADPTVGLVLVVGLFGGYHLRFDPALADAEGHTAHELVNLVRSNGIPLLVQSCYAGDHPANHDTLRSGGVPVLGSIDHAVRAATAVHRRGEFLATADRRSPLRLPTPVAAQRQPHAELLDEPEARRLVDAAGLATGPWRLARTAADTHAAVTELGTPCAVKVVSPQVTHKSDVGGVRLGITPHTAADAHTAIVKSVSAAVPDAEITGMLVTPMAPPGVELLVGATHDAIFGPVVAFGSGGVHVETLRDVTFRAAPCTTLEAREMIAETAAARLLGGARSLPPVDIDTLAAFLVRVAEFAATTPGLAELDLNPVIASATSIVPADVRVVTDRRIG